MLSLIYIANVEGCSLSTAVKIRRLEESLADAVGGFTWLPGTGGWRHEGVVVTEPVRVYHIIHNGDWAGHATVQQFARDIKEVLGEKVVLIVNIQSDTVVF